MIPVRPASLSVALCGACLALAAIMVAPAIAVSAPASIEEEMRGPVDAARPSIVTVVTRRPFAGSRGSDAPPRRGRMHVGSGVVFDDLGHVVTTASVADVDDEIHVETASGQRFAARLLVRDPTMNVALLELSTRALRSIRLGSSSDLVPGSWVALIGYSSGSREASSALGTVSAPFSVSGLREGGSVLTVNAPVLPGWSGGAVLNTAGELVGLVAGCIDGHDRRPLAAPVAGTEPAPGGDGGEPGATVIVPVEQLREALAQILVPEGEGRGFLGVRVVGLTPYLRSRLGAGQETRGVVVYEILQNSPAERAGLRSGDVIVGLGSHPVSDVGDLTRRVAAMSPGTHADLGYVRDGFSRRVSVEIGGMPPALREEETLTKDAARLSDRRKFLLEEVRRLEADLERYRRELSTLNR